MGGGGQEYEPFLNTRELDTLFHVFPYIILLRFEESPITLSTSKLFKPLVSIFYLYEEINVLYFLVILLLFKENPITVSTLKLFQLVIFVFSSYKELFF